MGLQRVGHDWATFPSLHFTSPGLLIRHCWSLVMAYCIHSRNNCWVPIMCQALWWVMWVSFSFYLKVFMNHCLITWEVFCSWGNRSVISSEAMFVLLLYGKYPTISASHELVTAPCPLGPCHWSTRLPYDPSLASLLCTKAVKENSLFSQVICL